MIAVGRGVVMGQGGGVAGGMVMWGILSERKLFGIRCVDGTQWKFGITGVN